MMRVFICTQLSVRASPFINAEQPQRRQLNTYSLISSCKKLEATDSNSQRNAPGPTGEVQRLMGPKLTSLYGVAWGSVCAVMFST